MSLSIGLIAVVALVYMAILFAIAFYGDRRRTRAHPACAPGSTASPWQCTAPAGPSSARSAGLTDQLWSFLPIYLGPVLLMLFAPWVLQKMIMISKQENITSIADFIAARYGKSQALAVVVALICMVGVLPYIALQLKGIVLGVNLLIGSGADSTGTRAQDTALIVSLVLALFTIVFGTRSLDVTEHHRGMVLAIAFESLVKLTAFLAVGIFVTFGLYDGFADLFSQARAAPQLADYWEETVHWPAMLLQTGVAMTAIMCLPRQFHVTVVENIEPRDLNLARWVFPIYLVLAALFVVPIAPRRPVAPARRGNAGLLRHQPAAGRGTPGAGPAGIHRRRLGRHRNGHRRQRRAVDHGLQRHAPAVAAATPGKGHRTALRGLPSLAADRAPGEHRGDPAARLRGLPPARLQRQPGDHRPDRLRRHRPARPGDDRRAVLETGQPPRGLRRPRRRLAAVGLYAGPAGGGQGPGWPLERIPGLTWLASNPFGLPIEPLTQGVLISLVGNFALFGLVSVLSRTRVSEHWQASRFIGQEISQRQNSRFMLAVQVEDLLMLAARFVGEERARQKLHPLRLPPGQGLHPEPDRQQRVDRAHRAPARRVLGASSARAVVKAAIEGREMQVEDVVRIADEASEVLQFNRALLQGAIENITQGISVVDQSLRLVAWNHRYLELFEYPDGLIYVGRPIADIIRYNADRGLCGPAIRTCTWPSACTGCARALRTPPSGCSPTAGSSS